MLLEPKCFTRRCEHFIGIGPNDPDAEEVEECVYCEAFPDGIPYEIAYGDNPLTSPHPGDNGIRYEKK